MSSFAQISLITLTATPPYDSEPALWQRYMNLCGEKENRVLTKKKVESPLK
ncbi:hypothetical protein [Streptococcus sp. Marseille-P7376]|uniref:hypothetical protein n=1 Tax=Streptococcus sp. Marseille-P7376 TaxID=2592044 RepID=UPI00292A433A|nr:hypothetical protein [Streptococcus sp. Marseille-P7376]